MCYRSTDQVETASTTMDEETDTEAMPTGSGTGHRDRPFEDLIDLPVRALGRLKARLG